MASSSPRLGMKGLLVTCFFAFLLVGAEQSLYGPAFETFQRRYGLGAPAVSLTVSLHFLGAFLAILASGVLIRRFGYPRLLALSTLLLTAGVASIALAASWTLVLVGSFAAGLGFGVLDVGINLLVVRSIPGRVGPALNLLNAMFGVGAIAGPVLIAAFVPAVERAFLVVAALGLLVSVLAWFLPQPEPEVAADPTVGVSLLRASAFVVIYFLYVSSEVGAASWEATHLAPYYGAVQAATFTSFYWGALTLGRILAAPVSALVRPGPMVLAGAGLGLVAALFTRIPSIAPLAYALMGLAFAPIFPSVLAWLHETFPRRSEQLAPFALAGATLGPVATAPLIGLAVQAGGPQAVPLALTLLITSMLLVSLGLYLFGRRGDSGG